MPKRRRYGSRKSYGSKRRKVSSRKYSTKRSGYRKKRMGRAQISKVRFTGVADALTVKLKYQSTVILTSTFGAVADVVYRGNSLFDPAVSISTLQPYWFDQYASLYNYYKVLGSAIHVQAFNQGVSGSGGTELVGEVSLIPNLTPAAFSPTSHDIVNGQAYLKQRMLQQGSKNALMKSYMSSAKIYGRTKYASRDSHSQTAISTDPAWPWFWHICYNTLDRSNTSDIIVKLDIIYYVRFSERAIQAVS